MPLIPLLLQSSTIPVSAGTIYSPISAGKTPGILTLHRFSLIITAPRVNRATVGHVDNSSDFNFNGSGSS